jgi:putative nucleotidyltransferase with HDIG domain
MMDEDELRAADEVEERAAHAAATSLAATMSKAHGVRAFPQSAQRLLEVVRDPSFRVDEIADTIESDTSLAARVLRVVNSPVFGLRVQIRRIRVAVTLLGVKNLTEIATAAAVLDWFEDEAPGVPEIFRHSSAVAALARQIAPRCGLSPEEMYSCGLLHDFGKLIMIQSGDDDYAALVLEFANQPDLMHVKERELYGFDHAVLGAHIFSEWKIPEPLPRVIALHHQPLRAFRRGDNVGRMVAVLRWAERLAHDFELGRTLDETWLDEMSRDESVLHLDIARADFGRFCNELEKTYRDGHKIAPPEVPIAEPTPIPFESPAPPTVDVSHGIVCVVCGELASADSCPRCKVLLCPAHASKDGVSCQACASLPSLPSLPSPSLDAYALGILDPFWRPATLSLVVGALSLACLAVGIAPMWAGRAGVSRWWAYLPAVFGVAAAIGVVGVRVVERALARRP